VVRLLVERDDVTADSKDIRGQTSLSWQSKGLERKISGCSHDNFLKLSNLEGDRHSKPKASTESLFPPTLRTTQFENAFQSQTSCSVRFTELERWLNL
jgi:hypothetical protein